MADLPSAQTGVNRLYRSTPIAKKDVEAGRNFVSRRMNQ